MTATGAPRGAAHSRTEILAVVERSTLEQIQDLAQAALDFASSVEDEINNVLSVGGRLRDTANLSPSLEQVEDDLSQVAILKRLGEAAAARAGIEELLDLVDRELSLKALPGEHRREVRCLGEPISLRGANPVSLGIAARAVEMSPINLAHARMFPPESRR